MSSRALGSCSLPPGHPYQAADRVLGRDSSSCSEIPRCSCLVPPRAGQRVLTAELLFGAPDLTVCPPKPLQPQRFKKPELKVGTKVGGGLRQRSAKCLGIPISLTHAKLAPHRLHFLPLYCHSLRPPSTGSGTLLHLPALRNCLPG